MAEGLVYRGDTFFRDGESFCILPFAEAEKRNSKLHSHDFVEICYVFAGSGYHSLGGREIRVQKGGLFLINYDVEHVFHRERDGAELWTYNILFKPGFLDENLLPFRDVSSLTQSYLFKDAWSGELERTDVSLDFAEQREFDVLISNMHQEYRNRRNGYLTILRAYMIELIVKIARALHRRNAEDTGQRSKAHVIEEAVRYLDSHYHEPIKLAELAGKSYLSKNYFCQLFKETTGMTVSQYMQQARIEKACALMADPSRSMTQIAQEVGYGDYKAFYLAFKKLKGCPPYDYQKYHLR